MKKIHHPDEILVTSSGSSYEYQGVVFDSYMDCYLYREEIKERRRKRNKKILIIWSITMALLFIVKFVFSG